jgi:hypothetical protein
MFPPYRYVPPAGLVDGGGDLHHQGWKNNLLQIEAGAAASLLKIGSDVAVKIDNVQMFINQESGWGITASSRRSISRCGGGKSVAIGDGGAMVSVAAGR